MDMGTNIMRVLFVCVANVNRSQIAEAIFNRTSKKNTGFSAGLAANPRGMLLKQAHNDKEGDYPPILPMKELGYDLSRKRVKRLNRKIAESADKIVFIFNKRKHQNDIPKYLKDFPDIEFWDVHSIRKGISFEEYCALERKRIKAIRSRVKKLVGKIG